MVAVVVGVVVAVAVAVGVVVVVVVAVAVAVGVVVGVGVVVVVVMKKRSKKTPKEYLYIIESEYGWDIKRYAFSVCKSEEEMRAKKKWLDIKDSQDKHRALKVLVVEEL